MGVGRARGATRSSRLLLLTALELLLTTLQLLFSLAELLLLTEQFIAAHRNAAGGGLKRKRNVVWLVMRSAERPQSWSLRNVVELRNLYLESFRTVIWTTGTTMEPHSMWCCGGFESPTPRPHNWDMGWR